MRRWPSGWAAEMRFAFVTQPAIFLERPNRYLVIVQLRDGQIVQAHCPDPGRLRELLIPGVTVHVSPASHTLRKTAYDLRFVEHPVHGQLISLDTRLPNQVAWEGLQTGFFTPFVGYSVIEREVRTPIAHSGIQSRIDFRLWNAQGQPCWIEVKSATLVEARIAQFPDAVTERGRRHLLELIQLRQAGARTAVLFIVQRPDADCVMPKWETDPEFGKTLAGARAAGVELYAYTCTLTTTEMELAQPIPVLTDTPRVANG
jgi:sugar fermentation stimulation protein A